MKKFICILAALAALTSVAIAQENDSEKVRLDLVVADTISTNIVSTVNNTNLGIRIGLNDNKVGLLAGGMIREGFCTSDLQYGFPVDYYISANPYIGVELWNTEILGGIIFLGGGDFAPYVSAAYNFDLIKPTTGTSDRLSLKLGLEYFFDQYQGKHGVHKDAENAGVGAAAVDVLSLIIPKASIGLQYTFGWGF